MSASPYIGLLKLALIVPLLAYLGLVLFALIFANGLIFPAPSPGKEADSGLTRFSHNEKGHEVTLRYIQNPDSPFLVFYHHGNGEDLSRIEDRLEALSEAGFSVLAWNYPGYGSSDGRPSEREVLRIAAKIWESIPDSFGFSHQQTLLYGRSIGSGPATWLASQGEAAGLIIEGGFTSIFDVALPVKLLPWDIFDNEARLAGVRCPVLIIHGTRDETVPYSHGRALFEAAPSPKFFLWISGGMHNDLIEGYPENYLSSIGRFRDFLLGNTVQLP
ncbi:MAG: alpha/beta hydrolase [Oceanipulchritudo sp.]